MAQEYKARPLYRELAAAIGAFKGMAKEHPWYDKWEERIALLVDKMPSSRSVFDEDTKLDLDASHAEKLVFTTEYHHMNDGGYYDGWTEHTITVTPSFSGINLRISGRDRNDIKEYIHDTFYWALMEDVTYDLFLPDFPQYEMVHKWENQDGTESKCYQAIYVDGKRFWNDYAGARDYAARQMDATRVAPHAQ